MWIKLLINWWREITIIVLCVSFYEYLGFKNSEMKDLVIERNQYKMALDYQNAALLKEAEKHKRKLAELPKEITTIKTRYVAVYGGIDNFEKDENESDCNASYRLLTAFPY